MTSSISDPSVTAGDVAGIILRAALAGTMIAHGLRHARTLEGRAGWFGSIGFDKPELQARASAAVEIGSGAGGGQFRMHRKNPPGCTRSLIRSGAPGYAAMGGSS
jgi:hypothetical protein